VELARVPTNRRHDLKSGEFSDELWETLAGPTLRQLRQHELSVLKSGFSAAARRFAAPNGPPDHIDAA
jgi:hypothetical protein